MRGIEFRLPVGTRHQSVSSRVSQTLQEVTVIQSLTERELTSVRTLGVVVYFSSPPRYQQSRCLSFIEEFDSKVCFNKLLSRTEIFFFFFSSVRQRSYVTIRYQSKIRSPETKRLSPLPRGFVVRHSWITRGSGQEVRLRSGVLMDTTTGGYVQYRPITRPLKQSSRSQRVVNVDTFLSGPPI